MAKRRESASLPKRKRAPESGKPVRKAVRHSGAIGVSGATPVRAPSKYDQLSVFDPVRKRVTLADGSVVERVTSGGGPTVGVHPEGELDARPLSDVPHPLRSAVGLYVCETADDATMVQLAALAGETVSALQHRRRNFGVVPESCPEIAPPGRRRCHRCPFWRLHPDATPFS